MSEEMKLRVEPFENIVIDGEDANNITAFFEHFDIPLPDYLKEACTNFNAAVKDRNPAAEKEGIVDLNLLHLQNQVRVQLCRCFVEHPSPVFKDDLFKVVVENSKQIAFAAFFQKQLEDACSQPTEGTKP